MCPHTNYFHDSLIVHVINCTWLFYNLIDKPVLYIDSPGISACEISYELFISRRHLIWVFSYDICQFFGF